MMGLYNDVLRRGFMPRLFVQLWRESQMMQALHLSAQGYEEPPLVTPIKHTEFFGTR
jgi:hypothetical protein